MTTESDAGREGGATRVLLLYGSVRPGSFSHLLVEAAAGLLRDAGKEVKIFDPSALPLPQSVPGSDPKVQELHQAFLWSDAQFWCSPENYGAMSAVLKAQIDWAPPVIDGQPLFRGKPLAIAQVNGADASMSATIQLATVGRWLGMFVVPDQLCIPRVQEQFGPDGALKPGPYGDQLANLVAGLVAAGDRLRATD